MDNAKRLALSPASFTGILDAMGISYEEQSGFFKVNGPQGSRMYVGKGKITTTVHLSGFTAEFGARALEKSPSAKVTQEMDWPEGLGPVEQLRLFADLVKHMMSLAPQEKKARSASSSPAPTPVLIDASLVLGDQLEA